MAFQYPKHQGWCPSNGYQVHEVTGPALRKRPDRPRQQKGHVTFKTNVEDPITVVEAPPVAEAQTETTSNRVNAIESVDQKADDFIKQGHIRIELARLKSLGK
ncbi:uncharacterized protein LOC133317893 [Gastrolobium bilobum]|uniref:uncharacterized protein LOC133317893 n=1 Tax=Gastrolobium bilobum TaxID=150636 RepID=UPI002AAF6B63|nr:uncharacterized protein LOC133317893 [Gastrolobium bilobum]